MLAITFANAGTRVQLSDMDVSLTLPTPPKDAQPANEVEKRPPDLHGGEGTRASLGPARAGGGLTRRGR
jgi:hypothetical protein